MAGEVHVYLKGKRAFRYFRVLLVILSFIESYVWNFLKIKIHARLPKGREKYIFCLVILITTLNGFTECSLPRNYAPLTRLITSQDENYVLSFLQLSQCLIGQPNKNAVGGGKNGKWLILDMFHMIKWLEMW